MTTDTLVTTDSRGRVTVGHPDQRFRLTETSDGALILEPVMIMSSLERRFLANADLQAQIAHARAHPELAVERPRRHMSTS